MRIKSIAITAAAFLAISAQAQALKPGLWETEATMGGDPKLEAQMKKMQEQLASMPPAQRKMMEQMLASQGVSIGGGGAIKVKICITPEQAKKQDVPMPTKGDCTTEIKSKTKTSMKMHFECTNPASSGDAEYSFPNDKSYKGVITTTQQLEGQARNTRIDSSGQWLGESCEGVAAFKMPAQK
ncbi:DUF3617 domain-containing protein [Hydrogenophaga sp. 5NK40-0174]|uniref:DUF3617 domain-containing protein n=1 Tax=Hydrogenophaga sp. 5NK40-0174 TaxID=3127649 RepID=UPI00310C658F